MDLLDLRNNKNLGDKDLVHCLNKMQRLWLTSGMRYALKRNLLPGTNAEGCSVVFEHDWHDDWEWESMQRHK